jgi:hypothetical protein
MLIMHCEASRKQHPCIFIHSRFDLKESWKFVLLNCPLCKSPNKAQFLLKPYTAGVRALSTSGQPGDASTIDFLKKLQARLLLPRMNIREYFDIAIGTGLGLSASNLEPLLILVQVL